MNCMSIKGISSAEAVGLSDVFPLQLSFLQKYVLQPMTDRSSTSRSEACHHPYDECIFILGVPLISGLSRDEQVP